MSDTGLYVIGDENAVFGFGLVGVEGQAVHSTDEAHKLLQRVLADPTVDVVLVTDEWAAALRGEIDQLRMTLSKPLIVEIPGGRQTGERPSLRALLRQTLGVQLEV